MADSKIDNKVVSVFTTAGKLTALMLPILGALYLKDYLDKKFRA